MILYDFECTKCAHVFEEFGDMEARVPVNCPSCAVLAKRLISAPRFDPSLGLDRASFPTLADKWERTRRQRMQIESKQGASRGD